MNYWFSFVLPISSFFSNASVIICIVNRLGTPIVGIIIHGQVVIVADVASENWEVVRPRYIAETKSAIPRMFQIIDPRLTNYIPY
jgi:hypothetical protein